MLRRPPPPMAHPLHHGGYASPHSNSPPLHNPFHHHTRKRSRPHDELQLDLHGLQSYTSTPEDMPLELTPHGRHARPQASPYHRQAPFGPLHPHQHQQQHAHLHQLNSSLPPHQQQHPVLAPEPQHLHHHRLPNQPPPNKIRRLGYPSEPSPPPTSHGPPSVVGQEGMPPPAARPRGPKLKFTPEDDQLLVDLKEKKNLTWKQIADFFPGRSSGTLQVRYCTKLKAKTTVWTEEMVQKLRTSLREYDNDRWRIISTKVGSGFSPAACKEKAAEIAAADHEAGIVPADAESETDVDADAQSATDSASLPVAPYEGGHTAQHSVSHSADLGAPSILSEGGSVIATSTSEVHSAELNSDDAEGIYVPGSGARPGTASTEGLSIDFR